MKRQPKVKPEPQRAIEWKRANPVALAAFDQSTKQCSMGCGQHSDDPRSWKECQFMCDECYTVTPTREQLLAKEVAAKIPIFGILGAREKSAVISAISDGETFGYRNLMTWLATMWNIRLMEQMPHIAPGKLPRPTVTTTPYQVKL